MLTVETRLTLEPWFREKTLTKAEELRAGGIMILPYRNACAALFPNLDGHCLVDFEPAPQISQGFRLRATECSICSHPQKSGDRCVHVAALTIKVLQKGITGLFPAPLRFTANPWQQISNFMYEQTASRPVISQQGKEECALSFKIPSVSIQVAMSQETRLLLPILFNQHNFPKTSSHSEFTQDSVKKVREHLYRLCRTDNERALNQLGRTSKGQEREASLWIQLCRQLFTTQPDPVWQLRRTPEHLFSLLSGPADKPDTQLTPNRKNTIPLLKKIGGMNLIKIEGAARTYSKIFFTSDSSLEIEPWLELEDGNCRALCDLENYIFGSYCSIKNNIFQKIQEQKDDFSPQSSTSSLPLLAFAEKRDPAASIIIPAEKVPAFLDKHLQTILNGDHDVDPALEKFSINDLPDAIEVLDYSEDDEWCYLSARYTCGSRQLDLRDILALRRQGKQHATCKGQWLQVSDTPLDWLYKLGDDRLEEGSEQSTMRLTKLEMMALTSLVPELTLPTQDDRAQKIKSRLQNLKFKKLAKADIPSHLRSYQQSGLAWLSHLNNNGIGGILADDMGLGKTHQALGLLQITLKMQRGPALVICPASVLPHWQDKIDSFYPDLDYAVYYGQGRTLPPIIPAKLLLTTYGIMRQDIEVLRKLSFGPIIFDEIQYLKNQRTATSKAAAQLQGKTQFGLSGTPIENSLTDLKSIYDLCLPGLLGSNNDFLRTYVTPIEEKKDQQRLAVLQRLTSPFMLRRNKSTVLKELPEVIEDVRLCYLSADQQTLYQQAIDHEGQELLAAASDTSTPFPHMSFLALMQRLKQICNHPCQLAGNTDYQHYSSGKWELFKEIVKECLEADMKVVVFSQYTSMLDIIECYLQDMNISYRGLRGSTTMGKRRQQVESFNNTPEVKVFCASLLAGGTGIDLTGAQAVIHYDRWWNSAREEQATARVHRFGQKQAVQVFKFITTGTMEEKIHRLINKKQDLADDAVQFDDGSIIKQLSREEIGQILQWTP